MNTPNKTLAAVERFFPLLGNGKMLCRFHGADLSGLRPFYDAPSLLFFRTVFSQTPTDFVRRFQNGALLYRWLFQSDTDTKACLIHDSLLEGSSCLYPHDKDPYSLYPRALLACLRQMRPYFRLPIAKKPCQRLPALRTGRTSLGGRDPLTA